MEQENIKAQTHWRYISQVPITIWEKGEAQGKEREKTWWIASGCIQAPGLAWLDEFPEVWWSCKLDKVWCTWLSRSREIENVTLHVQSRRRCEGEE